eukprot:TRINITY_DN2997_c0_g1_i1.p1 TRINITY_DN2997_c0_g1~~TRINITY_DN2997_c0_g1_i1.p1  ORF type:complete len:185 (+),score=32.35 TRINITY_DN2997_c0_g1_i1:66-620(+)
MQNITRGALVVFEGIDRCGKSTQSRRLVNNLNKKNLQAIHMRFPNRETQTGLLLDSYLRCKSETEDHAIHLIFAANRWEASKTVRKYLEEGTTVVVDRYAYSGVAFTCAKGYDIEWCKNPDVGLPRPDVVIFLKLPVEEAMKRGRFGEERYENFEFQMKVCDVYSRLVEENWVVCRTSFPSNSG